MKRLYITAVATILMAGCKTIKYVPVIETHTDTVMITKQQRDSIWLHDSIYLHEWTVADTVYLLQEKWHTKYIEKVMHDTVYRSRTDSVPVPYSVTEYVEKELSWWQRTRLALGNLMLSVMVGAIVYGIWQLKKMLW